MILLEMENVFRRSAERFDSTEYLQEWLLGRV